MELFRVNVFQKKGFSVYWRERIYTNACLVLRFGIALAFTLMTFVVPQASTWVSLALSAIGLVVYTGTLTKEATWWNKKGHWLNMLAILVVSIVLIVREDYKKVWINIIFFYLDILIGIEAYIRTAPFKN